MTMIKPADRFGENWLLWSATLALSLTLLAVVWLSWMAFRDYRYVTIQAPRRTRIEELRGQVLLFDEILTMSARMAVATGDPQWEARYRRFEPQLDQILKEAMRLAPAAASHQATAQTDAAKTKLVALENRAFELVRQGQQAGARQVLSSDEYEAQKKAYADGMVEFSRSLKQTIDSMHSRRQVQVFWNVVTAAVSVPSLMVVWWVVLRTVQRWRTALVVSNRQLAGAISEVDRFFTLSLDLLCIADMNGYFKRVSPSFNQTLGWTTDELVARPFLDLVHPDDRAATLAEVEKLSRGVPTIQFENRYQCQDGSWQWLSWKSQPVVEEGLLYATARDITKRKQAEEQIAQLNTDLHVRAVELAEANKELESFSYSVSHDLRAPLRSIDGFSQVLLEDYADHLDEEGKDNLQRVRKAAKTMGQLIDALLALSRVSRTELRADRVDLSALAATIAAELRESQPDRQAEFVIAPGLLVTGDQTLLRAALGNLLGNAWKYTQPRVVTRIEFGCFDRENDTVYFVRDNGVGFDMTYVGKLFGAFQRLHRQSEFGGTGIGLATVQRIIHRHGGRAWAEGEVDQGATFYFTLHGQTRIDMVGWANAEAPASVS